MLSEDNLQKLMHNLAIKYISKYSTSSKNLQEYLINKIKKLEDTNLNISTIENTAKAVIDKLITMKYINDVSYTKFQVDRLLSAGKSTSHIYNKLYEKGIEKALVKEAINAYNNDDINMFTLIKTIKAKHFFCFNKKEPTTENQFHVQEKQINYLVRKGFSFDIIKKVINKQQEELDDIYYMLKEQLKI